MSRLSSTTLHIGDPAPPFSLPTLDGERFHLGDAVRAGIALIVFVPGSWSPTARRQMTELAALHPAFEEAGIGIVMIVTQDAGSLRRRLEATPPPFPVLADEDRAVARDFGVFRALSWDGIGVTRPAAFVIDPDGAIRFLYVGERDNDAPDARSLLRLVAWLRDKLPIPGEAEVLEGEEMKAGLAEGDEALAEAIAVEEGLAEVIAGEEFGTAATEQDTGDGGGEMDPGAADASPAAEPLADTAVVPALVAPALTETPETEREEAAGASSAPVATVDRLAAGGDEMPPNGQRNGAETQASAPRSIPDR